jgi:hypothetical protein
MIRHRSASASFAQRVRGGDTERVPFGARIDIQDGDTIAEFSVAGRPVAGEPQGRISFGSHAGTPASPWTWDGVVPDPADEGARRWRQRTVEDLWAKMETGHYHSALDIARRASTVDPRYAMKLASSVMHLAMRGKARGVPEPLTEVDISDPWLGSIVIQCSFCGGTGFWHEQPGAAKILNPLFATCGDCGAISCRNCYRKAGEPARCTGCRTQLTSLAPRPTGRQRVWRHVLGETQIKLCVVARVGFAASEDWLRSVFVTLSPDIFFQEPELTLFPCPPRTHQELGELVPFKILNRGHDRYEVGSGFDAEGIPFALGKAF